MVVGDDDLQPERPCFGDLGHRSDPAVDRDHEAAFLPRETRERVDRDAVSLLETTREVPVDVCAERAEDGDGERGRADAVGVVVAMDADPLARGNCPANRVTRLGHVSQESGVVSGPLAGEKGLRLSGVAVAPPDEDARCRLAEAERLGELDDLRAGARTHGPCPLLHPNQR